MPADTQKTSYLYAIAVFAGTVFGVGLFGLPEVAMRAGFLVVLLCFVLLIPVVIATHSMLADIACNTKRIARVPGYAEEYTGKKGKYISFVASFGALLGAQLAYLIVGGKFLYLVFSPLFGGFYEMYVVVFFLFGAVLIYLGIRSISSVEAILLFILLFILVLFFVKALPYINVHHFIPISLSSFFLPYGIVMFSLWGTSVVPEVKDMLDGNFKKVRRVIVLTTLGTAALYILFVITIFVSTGNETSPEALEGFARIVGQKVIIVGYMFGLITTFTSFLTIGLTLKKILWLDFAMNESFAWFVAMIVPLMLWVVGFDNFITIIGLTGAVLLGVEALVILVMYKNFAKLRKRTFPFWGYIVMFVLLGGILSEIMLFFF